MNEQRLRKFFRFTEADLLANRRLQFSESQKQRLSQDAKKEQASARSSAVILLVVAGAGLAIGVTIGSIAPEALGRTLILLLMGILWPAVWAGKAVQILRAAYALQEPRLGQVSGQARLIRHTDGSHSLNIGGHEFDLDGHPSGAIVEGDEYTVYYVERTEEILSVEIGYPNRASL